MLIQINTDNNINGSEELRTSLTSIISKELDRFSEKVTRIEAHLNDTNSHKAGTDDIRCMLEARMEGMQPVAVTHHAGSTEQAVKGAAEKMKSALSTIVEKQRSY